MHTLIEHIERAALKLREIERIVNSRGIAPSGDGVEMGEGEEGLDQFSIVHQASGHIGEGDDRLRFRLEWSLRCIEYVIDDEEEDGAPDTFWDAVATFFLYSVRYADILIQYEAGTNDWHFFCDTDEAAIPKELAALCPNGTDRSVKEKEAFDLIENMAGWFAKNRKVE